MKSGWMKLAALVLLASASVTTWGATKGPDAAGYSATGTTVYSYVDISGGGGGTAVLAGTDDGTAALTLPFHFQFYAGDYTMVCASTNGALYFVPNSTACADISGDFANVDLSSSTTPGDLPGILPFWTDLDFSVPAAGAVYYQSFGTAPNRRFVVQWVNAYPQGSGNPVNFQVILSENGNTITIQYQNVSLAAGDPAANGATATVGLRDSHASGNNRQMQWSFNVPVIADGSALLFQAVAPGSPALVSPNDQAAAVTLPVTLTWSAANYATSYDVYFGTANPPTLVANTTALSYQPSGLAAGTAYFWKVIAKDSAGSAESAAWKFTTAASSNPPPAGGGGGVLFSQTITFAELPGHTADDLPFNLSATSSSGLAVTFSVVSGPATINGNTVTITGPGTVIVQADQAGNASFAAAPFVQRTFVVSPGVQKAASIANGASYAKVVLAGEAFASIFGSAFATQPQVGQPPYPTQLVGVTVSITDADGVRRIATLSYVSPTQINVVLPRGLATGMATVSVQNSAGQSSTLPIRIGSVAPGLFTGDSTGQGSAAAFYIVVSPDGTQHSSLVSNCSGAPLVCTPNPVDLGPDGTRVYVTLYGTGIRGRSSLAGVTVMAGGLPLEVSYAGAQSEYPGLDQVNVLIPRTLSGRGQIPVQLTVDGVAANPVTISVK